MPWKFTTGNVNPGGSEEWGIYVEFCEDVALSRVLTDECK